jgi:uncharacterized protein
MPRPKKSKIVGFEPGVTYFKPRAVPLSRLQEVEITHEELETLRLANLEKLSQSEAASMMGVHQSTFQRILSRARENVSDALVNGKAIKIKGGEYKMPGKDGTGPAGFKRGFGGPTGVCKCPKCGKEYPHLRGQPCNQRECPECGSLMVRG